MSQDARLIKLTDRLTNIRDLRFNPPKWPIEKIENYYVWGKKLLKAPTGTNEALEKTLLEEIYDSCR